MNSILKNKRSALAMHLMLDYSEVEDYRYHQGRTSQAVYAFEGGYYCVTKGSQKPAVHRDGFDWTWQEVADAHLNAQGYKIWKSDTINE